MEFFKKTFIGIIAAIIFIMLILGGLSGLDEKTKDQSFTITNDRIITIGSHKLASQPMLVAPYKTMDIFISEEHSADFDFTSVGGSWDEIAPEGTVVQAEVRFKIDGEWTGWIELEEEEDAFAKSEDGVVKKYAMASSDPADAFQYKYSMFGDGSKVPLIKNSSWTFIKAGQKINLEPAPKPQYSSYVAVNTELVNLNTSNVLSREEWGADESYRYVADNNADVKLVELDPDFYDKYSEELGYSRVVEQDENGDKYKWPLQFPEKVQKVIIHHTATTGNLDNPPQAIRDIYHYHAITRGWGDIGYNYLVDQQGNIYEGRYGGEGVIGAHSGPGNHGSIGIAILGNFEDSPAPEEAIVGLSKFVYRKAKIHGINTQGTSDFRGKERDNIFGHRDIMPTDCPGQYLYEKIPVIRVLAAKNPDLKEKFTKDYDYQDISEIYYLEMKPESSMEVTIELQNIGKKDWNEKTYLSLAQDGEFEGAISFPTSEPGTAEMQNDVLAKMDPAMVKSDGNAKFKFKIKSGSKSKTVYLNITPVINGDQILEEKLVIPVTVQQPIYKYKLMESKLPGKIFKAGETFDARVKLRNDGNVSWQNSGDNAVTLADSILGISSSLEESTVAPGKSGTFLFTFTAPEKAGYYTIDLKPKSAEAKWISNEKISFSTLVYEREYDSELVSKTFINKWELGKNYTISFNLRNIGIEDWLIDDLKTTLIKESDLNVSELTLTPKTVKPGETGTLSFTVKVDENADLGYKVLLARPDVDGHKFSRMPLYFQYEVIEEQLQTLDEDQPEIRIKISFSGDPEITANGSFDVYSGENILTTLSAGDIATVSRESGKYRVKAGDSNFLKDGPIRFLPQSNSILKIKNYENHPSWNESLNDNEYRGILEVRDVDGTLMVINELPLEDYLKGLGEVSNSELPEKIKALMTAARTYAKYYIDVDEKFPGKPYNLDDDPNVSQKYIGYGFEKRAPNVASAVEETKGKIITYNGELVKTPYFNQSDGTKTKSAKEVWGWDAPYLISVDDSTCDGNEFLGHGVGLSGCGAKGMAESGTGYEEILKHYYTGIEIIDMY